MEALEKHLGTKVHFRPVTGKGPGQLGLEFYDEAHLYGLYERLIEGVTRPLERLKVGSPSERGDPDKTPGLLTENAETTQRPQRKAGTPEN